MPRIATRHVHQLAYRQRFSVGVRMFGCLLLIAGGIVLAAAIARARDRSISGTPWLTVSIGVVLAVCGAVLLCGERGKLIDRENRTVRRWWGILRPLWRSTRDVQSYQAVVVQPRENATLTRWQVNLLGNQADPLELFDLASHEAAQAVARQVAAFLSLTILLPGAAASPVLPQASAPAMPDDRWLYWRGRGRAFRFLGVALLALAGVLSLGGVASAVSHDGRWLIWLGIAAPPFVIGFCLLCGGRKIAVDRQSVRVWRTWPLPPAVYDLAAFYAIILVTTTEEGEPETCLMGLIGPEQLRLELVHAMPADEAREAALRLAATTNLPLIDESQTVVPSV